MIMLSPNGFVNGTITNIQIKEFGLNLIDFAFAACIILLLTCLIWINIYYRILSISQFYMVKVVYYDLAVGKKKLQICCLTSSNGAMLLCL